MNLFIFPLYVLSISIDDFAIIRYILSVSIYFWLRMSLRDSIRNRQLSEYMRICIMLFLCLTLWLRWHLSEDADNFLWITVVGFWLMSILISMQWVNRHVSLFHSSWMTLLNEFQCKNVTAVWSSKMSCWCSNNSGSTDCCYIGWIFWFPSINWFKELSSPSLWFKYTVKVFPASR